MHTREYRHTRHISSTMGLEIITASGPYVSVLCVFNFLILEFYLFFLINCIGNGSDDGVIEFTWLDCTVEPADSTVLKHLSKARLAVNYLI